MHGNGNGDICQHNYVYTLYPTNCANNELRQKEKIPTGKKKYVQSYRWDLLIVQSTRKPVS